MKVDMKTLFLPTGSWEIVMISTGGGASRAGKKPVAQASSLVHCCQLEETVMLEYHAAYYQGDQGWVVAEVLDFPGALGKLSQAV
jgi:hypothetical protein